METRRYREAQKTIKIWTKTHQGLRVLAALQGLSMVETLDRLVSEAMKGREGIQ